MAIVILLIIAFWFLPLPLALQILMTIFGSLNCLVKLIRGIVKGKQDYDKKHRRKIGYPELDRFL